MLGLLKYMGGWAMILLVGVGLACLLYHKPVGDAGRESEGTA